MDVKAIGIAGTAKNTGKTTTLSWLLQSALEDGFLPAVTSIGYDGEAVDNVTGLPKPRLAVAPGMLVATAERCLSLGSAQLKILERSSLDTPLGPVFLALVHSPGLVVLAGPNKTSDLKVLLQRIREEKASVILVDGAFGRLAPMQATDGLIMAQGAARFSEVSRLVAQTVALAGLFSLTGPAVSENAEGNRRVISAASLLEVGVTPDRGMPSEKGEDALVPGPDNRSSDFLVNGMLTLAALQSLVLQIKAPARIILENTIQLLLSGDVEAVWRLVSSLAEKGIEIWAQHPLPLLAFTINPFYPEWIEGSRIFRERYLQAEALEAALATTVPFPVFDVKRNGTGLWQLVKAFLLKTQGMGQY